MIVLAITCPFCGEDSHVIVYHFDYEEWKNGKTVQEAFSYLSATEREILISHLCPRCQAKIFKEP